jgi:tryptophan 2,3-dioxygenase
VEFLLGAKNEKALARFPEGSRAREALMRRYTAPTLWDAFVHYLAREGYRIPEAQLSRDVTTPPASSPR